MIFYVFVGQQFLQAEDATWDGPELDEDDNVLNFINSVGDWIQWTVSSDTAGPATIAFRYESASDRPLELKVNGVVLDSSLDFPSTSSFGEWQLVHVEVPLVIGDNLIRITAIGHSGGSVAGLIVVTWPSATTTTNSTSTTTSTAATTSSTAACLIEEISYGQGSGVNDGLADPRHNDAESCRSYCKSNYPNSIYFSWFSTTASWTQGHKRCFCKTSNADPENKVGIYSGNVHCVGVTSATSTTTISTGMIVLPHFTGLG